MFKMQFRILALFFIFCIFFIDSACSLFVEKSTLKPLVASENYGKNQVIIHQDDNNDPFYVLYWKLLDDEEIMFEVHVKNLGWVGLGISMSGGMRGADIAIGWVNSNGVAFLKDTWSEEKGYTPKVDAQNDLHLIDGIEQDGFTVLKFKRKLNTCDLAGDVEIKNETTYLIFGWNKEDPLNDLDNNWKGHSPNDRKMKSIQLTNYEASLNHIDLPADTFTVDLQLENIRVPREKDTYYWCEVYKVPSFGQDVHLIQFEVLVQKENLNQVHHVLVHECDSDYEEVNKTAQECGDILLPNYIASKCTNKLLFVWGVGRDPVFSFPNIAGYPIYNTNRKNIHFMLEIHYDNPNQLPNIVDSSTVRFYFTKSLRKFELGLMELGTDTPLGSPLNLLIPPKQKEVKFTSTCYPECTRNFVPPEGITLLNIYFHTHLSGRKVKTTLVRNDKMIREIRDNPWYDFNHQNVLELETLKIYPGDALITECVFNTLDRTKFTFWGYSSRMEMCNSNLYYYPLRRNMNDCNSHNTHNVLYDFYRGLMRDGLIPYIDLDETNQETQWVSNENIVKMHESDEFVFSAEVEKRFNEYLNDKKEQDITCWNRYFLNESIYKKPMPFYVPKGNLIVTPEEICRNKSITSAARKTRIMEISIINYIILAIVLCINLILFS